LSAPFRISQLRPNTVADVDSLRSAIDFQPTYQRQSDIWAIEKRQLFVDSLINGFDIPKLYFHDLDWDSTGPSKRYAIIDGKQRLEAIHSFVNGDFSLSAEFEDITQDSPDAARRAARLNYRELAEQYPDLKIRFDRAELPVVLVQTNDPELIDEMFSRLNEAVPLNAPEKRNALGGPLPAQIRKLVSNPLFASRLAFPNARYRHLDLATKFLYIEFRGGLTDLKKRDLDDFVREFKARGLVREALELERACVTNLERMSAVFGAADPLLSSVGMITIYYHIFRDASEEGWLNEIRRDDLVRFEDERAQNRARAREIQELALLGRSQPSDLKISLVLSNFERYVQSPNDVAALTQRYKVLRHFILEGEVPARE
jgi:hypothetical protein